MENLDKYTELERGYNLNEVAEKLGIKVRTVRDWVHKGKLKATKMEGSRRYVVLESEIRRIRRENED